MELRAENGDTWPDPHHQHAESSSVYTRHHVPMILVLQMGCIEIYGHGGDIILRMSIQDFFRTLSGPSCSFQDHIYESVVLHHHEINQCITSKVISWYKLHKNFFQVWKNDDFLENLENSWFSWNVWKNLHFLVFYQFLSKFPKK